MEPHERTNKILSDNRRRIDALPIRMREVLERRWNELGGPVASTMLQDQAIAVAQLSSSNPKIRICACEILNHQWHVKPGDELLERIHQLARNDSDIDVRVAAIAALASCCGRTDEPNIGRSFALIVINEAESKLIREKAYQGLLALRGLPLAELVREPQVHARPYTFQDDADWSFIESFLVEDRKSTPTDSVDAAMPHLSEDDRECLRCYVSAEKAFGAGQDDDAIRLLTRAIEKQPKAARAYHLRARAHFRLGQYDESIDDFTQALQLIPDSERAHFERGQAYEKKGLTDLAQSDYRRANEIRNNESE